MILRLLHRLAAPNRYPIPTPEERMAPPHPDDSSEELEKKLDHLTKLSIRVEMAKIWHARLSGWHSAILAFSTVNVSLLLYSVWIAPIDGVVYGLLLTALSTFMSLCSKRLVDFK